jgi:hypothetical protein
MGGKNPAADTVPAAHVLSQETALGLFVFVFAFGFEIASVCAGLFDRWSISSCFAPTRMAANRTEAAAVTLNESVLMSLSNHDADPKPVFQDCLIIADRCRQRPVGRGGWLFWMKRWPSRAAYPQHTDLRLLPNTEIRQIEADLLGGLTGTLFPLYRHRQSVHVHRLAGPPYVLHPAIGTI